MVCQIWFSIEKSGNCEWGGVMGMGKHENCAKVEHGTGHGNEPDDGY